MRYGIGMSRQITIPASILRGKDWRKLTPDDLDKMTERPLHKNAVKARCRIPAKGGYESEHMNALEARYASHLETRLMQGGILFWRYESMKLLLADRCSYLPDFFVVNADGAPEFHETKGFWRDDARVKIKVAAETFPCFNFYGVTWDKKQGWVIEHFKPKH